MDTVTAAPPSSSGREDYWARVQALRAELTHLRPTASPRPTPRRPS